MTSFSLIVIELLYTRICIYIYIPKYKLLRPYDATCRCMHSEGCLACTAASLLFPGDEFSFTPSITHKPYTLIERVMEVIWQYNNSVRLLGQCPILTHSNHQVSTTW